MPQKEERLRGPRYMVYWKARSMLQDRTIFPTVIKTVSQGGFAIELDQAVSRGKDINLEFYVNYAGSDHRIRLKSTVIYCMILSGNRGAYMEVKIKQISSEERQIINNILDALADSKEFDLRL